MKLAFKQFSSNYFHDQEPTEDKRVEHVLYLLRYREPIPMTAELQDSALNCTHKQAGNSILRGEVLRSRYQTT
jgi:hypothetical protein